ncbi:hypothetical protein V8G54_020111 [Vigna mungo]|uniref:Uncharacterized protein n=1 Tax=Vigna mungo TaxID=3915 RepID=A0AAQ3NB47_VIGMU
MSKGVIDDENYGFSNSIGKYVRDVVTNSSHEPIETRIEKVKVKDFSRSRRLNQEEKGYTNALKSATETTMESEESSETEETNLMANRFSKFLTYKRKPNLNFAGGKELFRKQELEEGNEDKSELSKHPEQQTNLSMMLIAKGPTTRIMSKLLQEEPSIEGETKVCFTWAIMEEEGVV